MLHKTDSNAMLFVGAALGLFFIPTTGPNILPLLPVSWSLFYELVVNILYALARPWLTTRALLVTCVVGYVALVAAAISVVGFVIFIRYPLRERGGAVVSIRPGINP